MGMSKPLIIFRLEYQRKTGWGAISNFITKFSEKIPMKLSDVEIVSSIVLEENQFEGNSLLIRKISDHSRQFKKIGRPENMYVNGEKFNYIFFISVEYKSLSDVVDLQNLYLISDACRQYRILSLIFGTQADYHKTSHYFTFLTEDKGRVYESIFFKDSGIKHLQLHGIGTLSKFLPLVPIDASEDIRLRRKVNEFVSMEVFKGNLKGDYKGKDIPRLLTGAFRKLSEQHKKLMKCDMDKCVACLGELNILSFLLFCFSLEGKADNFSDFWKFSEELQKVTLWSNGCIQLIENIVFHSQNKKGAFSFRILDGDAAYIREKYSMADTKGKWIEMMIADYAGCPWSLNMAERFRENLSDANARKAFENLNPRDFFATDVNEEITRAWKQYYSEKKNVVNHYGIKIFQRVIQNSEGHFVAQSFSSHMPRKEEFYYDVNDITVQMSEMCLPGTSYAILFPIGRESVQKKFSDFGIEGLENKINAWEILSACQRNNKSIPVITEAVSSQEKMELIEQITADLLNVEDSEDGSVIFVNALGLQSDMAEIAYKAMILTLLQSRYDCHIVMYGCRQEFVQMFLDVAYLGSINLQEDLNYEGGRQIVLYTAECFEEIIILPEDWESTRFINCSNHFSRETRWGNYFEKIRPISGIKRQRKAIRHYPFDVLAGENEGSTVFEKYAETVIKRNIQGQELGCKIENTHMRLGSTIHVNHFYEAEILFGNSLFVERFALLMIKRLLKPLDGKQEPLNMSDRITLYGYTNYSEQTVFRTMQFLQEVLPGIDVDYAILERESEDRGFTHVDRIRYSTYFEAGESGIENRKKHFQSRKIVCIIPIASTLKTNEKMINLFLEENGEACRCGFWKNFELILVGSTKENEYWKKDGKRIIGKEGMEILPAPEFFVEVTLDYMEPLKCSMCFPDQLMDEQPLIEVNAASTIPNQAFGLIEEKREDCKINKENLQEAEENLKILHNLLLYRHIERNENHFLFYFQTERLIAQYADEVCKWLSSIRGKIHAEQRDYIVLFCPAHFSNAGFIEYVNSCVFHNAATVIRDDVDKEYRCNFRTKFSNLRNFAEKMARNHQGGDMERRIRLFYVDDAIITGRTFHRARSLAQSIMVDYCLMDDRQRYDVFEGIFVLIDRNSKSSRWQYTGIKEEGRLYAFRTVQISSIRNHGDACVYCNLAKEAEALKKSSVTKDMEQYWRSEEKKFSVMPLGVYLRNREEIERKERPKSKRQDRQARAFRRLVCTNNAMIFLNEKYHGNCKETVLEQMLMLILEGSRLHIGEEREYFLSYCKVLSRPFRVFDKSVREAVFDFLLMGCICSLFGRSYSEVIADSEKKSYLGKEEIKEKFLEIEVFINKFFVKQSQKQELLKVLLKQLTEMKSNFIMRESVMTQILEYVDTLEPKSGEAFIRYYKYLIKKLTGISSDTSKSLWLDQMLYHEWKDGRSEIYRDIYLENVWIYQDAFQKLNERARMEPEKWETLLPDSRGEEFREKLISFEKRELEKYLKPYQFKDFISILQQYKMFDTGNGLTSEGKIFVAANFLLYRFITVDFESGSRQVGAMDKGNLTKVDYIAACMKYIFGAKEVVIVMEFDAEYDMWEKKIIERYNALLPKNMEQERIAWKAKKEYIILGSSEEKSGSWTIREKNVVKKAQEVQKEESWEKKGYVYDAAECFFWWELGYATEYPVYIFATWEHSGQDDTLEIERLNRIRGVMQYYWQLNNAVFNKSNEGFLCEIAQQRKKNAIHSRQKAHTHTKNDIKLEQYDHMLHTELYSICYQSDLLMLLADLNVSEHYRNSLTEEYYFKDNLLRPKRWNVINSPFVKQKEFEIVNSETTKTIKMILSEDVLFEGDRPLRDDELIQAFDSTNGERESFLLIYSLMINAVSNNRGKVENGSVMVYCSRTPEGDLRIANQIGENPDEKTPEQIMEELQYSPEEENQGISLWSMSRYIKGMIASTLSEELKELEKSELPIDGRSLLRKKYRILRFLGKEFQICVEKLEIGEKKYFSVSVPILAEKYEEQKEDCIK